jgi:hypothetical protein
LKCDCPRSTDEPERQAGAPGKTSNAIKFAHEITAYVKEAYKIELEILLPIGGNPQRIAWTTRYKDLAAFDAVSSKLLSDKHYWEVVGKGADNFSLS